MTPTRLVLFDIDGTLVLTGGAGKRAMDRAFEDAFGIGDAFADIAMGGRTDRFLIERGLERWGIPATGAALDLFRHRYLAHLADGIHEPGNGRKGTMPGVDALLDALEAQPQVQTALLTGNYAAGARIKLEHFGLWDRFAWGAFGDDYAERDALARAAVADAPRRGVHARRSAARGRRRRHAVRHRLRPSRRCPGGGGGHRWAHPRRVACPRPRFGRRDPRRARRGARPRHPPGGVTATPAGTHGRDRRFRTQSQHLWCEIDTWLPCPPSPPACGRSGTAASTGASPPASSRWS